MSFYVLCNAVGRVEIVDNAVTLALGTSPSEHTYEFACPGCGGVHSRPASAGVIAALLRSEARVERSEEPLSSLEADEFTEWLGRHDYLAAWTKGAQDGRDPHR